MEDFKTPRMDRVTRFRQVDAQDASRVSAVGVEMSVGGEEKRLVLRISDEAAVGLPTGPGDEVEVDERGQLSGRGVKTVHDLQIAPGLRMR